jgi:GT2 family glycosyltransferase
METPALSIVIPTYNGIEHLRHCLTSVRRHAPPGTQVLVVDDASTDGTREWLRREHPSVEAVALPANGGFCAAVNAGVARARGRVVELLNNDTEVCAGWAQAVLPHFADPRVGSVAPLVTFFDHPDVIDSAGVEYHICGWAKNRLYGLPLSGRRLSAREVFGPSASSGFYRREALSRAGALLPEYGAYYEDVDLAFRLRWAGYRCVFEPASRVLHKESASYRKQREHVVWLLARNEELVYWINLRPRELALGLVPHLGFEIVRAIRKTMQGQGRLFASAKWDALGRWRWILRRRRILLELARGADRPIHLRISTGSRVLRQGWDWMRRRKSA